MDDIGKEVIRRSNAVDLTAIKRVPKDVEERRLMGVLVSNRIAGLLRGRLSSREGVLWDARFAQQDGSEDMPETPTTWSSIWSKFDQVIIEEAATLGWRVILSDSVLARIQKWNDQEKKGPELLARFLDAIITNARIARGEEQHPLNSPEAYPSRRAALQEVRALCKKLNARLAVQLRLPELTELYAMIRGEILGTPSAYPFLNLNITSLCRYLELQDSAQQGTLTRRLATRQATAGEILNGWFDWAFCTAEGKSRQIISRLRKRKPA